MDLCLIKSKQKFKIFFFLSHARFSEEKTCCYLLVSECKGPGNQMLFFTPIFQTPTMNDLSLSLIFLIFRSWITSMTSWSLCSWSSHIFAWDEGSLIWWKTRQWLTPWRGLVSEAVAAGLALMEEAIFTGLGTLIAALGRRCDWVQEVCPPQHPL